MKVSVQGIKFLNEHYHSAGDPAPNGVTELIQKIGAQLAAVEETIPFGERFNNIIVVRIVHVSNHPNADRLHICKVDDGGTIPDLQRDEEGLVQIVCGAPNVREGMLAAWIPPGATVPSTFGEQEPFVVGIRPLRGEISSGMMASAKELALGDSHDGLLEIDQEAPPGTLFADVYHLKNDVIIDMENKMFTHRPDCFGWLGVAREIEGVYHRPYKSPEWYRLNPDIPGVESEELPLEVRNEIPELVPRFVAIVLRDVELKTSPVWLQTDLARAGIRSINNVVDYTNWYMTLTGQPIHAYDYDKVKALSNDANHPVLVIRKPRQGEQISLLNGKTITPRAEAMMVATDKQLICVGGAMGGGDTEVDEHTKNIIIEAANWDMYSMRRTSMAHGIFTDAVTRFTKGQSPLQNVAVIGKIVSEIRQFAGGKVASRLIDDNYLSEEVMQRGSLHRPVIVTPAFINARLGVHLTAENMQSLLENVEFTVTIQEENLTVAAPFWRTDIEIPEDVVEEVGRLYGFDHLPLELPARTLMPAPTNPLFDLKANIRRVLSNAGATEVLGYSFVHGNLLDKAKQDRKQAFQLANALSPELQFYRLGLTPSLLQTVHGNIKAGYDEFALFEMGRIHNTNDVDEDGLPREISSLSLVLATDTKVANTRPGAPYYQARAFLVHLLTSFSAMPFLQFEALISADLADTPWLQQVAASYEPGRSAVIRDQQGMAWGVIGEYKAGVRKALKLPDRTAGFELDPLVFLQIAGKHSYVALPRFPKVEQDICLKVPAETTYKTVFDFVWSELGGACPENTLPSLGPVDIYQRDDDPAHKQITLRLSLASYERTLTDQEVASILEKVALAASAIDATRV
ncbi:MAG TPA: phenylalanine--tRNA ligase subunit beta [Patescibacteria group bacterium]|nr:phenylalanine--tRNA ligase subunit beta [Patescibacteria group bacterium]